MKKRLKRIETKVDQLVDKQSIQNAILARQEENIAHHIKRTDLLENEHKKTKTFVDMALGAIKLIGAIGLGALIKALHG